MPTFRQDEDDNWVCDEQGDHVFDEAERDGYRVCRYRLRVEGLFAGLSVGQNCR